MSVFHRFLPSPYRTLRQALQKTPWLEWHTEQSVFPVGNVHSETVKTWSKTV